MTRQPRPTKVCYNLGSNAIGLTGKMSGYHSVDVLSGVGYPGPASRRTSYRSIFQFQNTGHHSGGRSGIPKVIQ